MSRFKPLHDDENGAGSPSTWLSVFGDDKVSIRWCGRGMNHYFRTSSFRIAWFLGWVSHITEARDSADKDHKVGIRVHASAYTKPAMEFLSLVLFSDTYRKQVIESFQES